MDDQLTLFDLPDEPRNPWDSDAEGEILAAQVVFAEGIVEPLDYAIPESLRGKVQKGCRLMVPLGKANRPREVFCVDVHTLSPSKIRLKYLSKVLDERPLFSGSMLELTRWISDSYLCPWGQVLQTVVPAGVRMQAGTRVTKVLTFSLKGKKALQIFESGEKAIPEFKITETQAKILRLLQNLGKSATAEELARRSQTTVGPVKLLLSHGMLAVSEQRVATGSGDIDHSSDKQEDLRLNTDQQAALDTLLSTIRDTRNPSQTVLLHGVTGSGKTELYIQAIREVVRSGRQAIVLVPEISLTPQTVNRFRKRFENIAVLHSHLTDAQRHAEWLRILRGEVEVVVGARSAVFAPVQRLGLIVMDEEHETSFKQETAPRYHARDVARERGRLEKAVVILGSATPSLESWHQAEIGNYRLIQLPRRVANRPLPNVETVDLRIRDTNHSGGSIGRKLHIAMRECLQDGHQMILLLNRRGYSTHIQCPECGEVLCCPHCNISMTHHRTTNEVVCHYCDHRMPAPETCPHCGSFSIRYSGTGTQRLETEVEKRFPDARILRMDTDSMRGRDAHENALGKFRAGEIDILLGTQMIAKGLDFPNVTLVGVISADTALHLPDFRAEERTFHLITQVAGRTGRGPSGGQVLVQSFQPENRAIQFACHHDYQGFAEYALPARKLLGYPPFGFMARLVIRGTNPDKTLAFAEKLGTAVKAGFGLFQPKERVLGPAPCPFEKIQDNYRFHIQIQSPDRSRLVQILKTIRGEIATPDDVQWILDMDPLSML